MRIQAFSNRGQNGYNLAPRPCIKLGPELPKEVIEHEPFLLRRVRLWPRTERDLAELAPAAALVASEFA